METSFGSGVLSTHALPTHQIIFFLLEHYFNLFDWKKVKYVKNAAFEIRTIKQPFS